MDILTSEAVGRVPVTVVHLDGQLDGQTYQMLIDKARELYQAGARNFLIDLANLSYISSAGLVALHSIALLTSGGELPDPEAGWATFRAMGKTSAASVQEHIKLLNPREEVKSVLDMVGFSRVFSMFTDLNEAVKSF